MTTEPLTTNPTSAELAARKRLLAKDLAQAFIEKSGVAGAEKYRLQRELADVFEGTTWAALASIRSHLLPAPTASANGLRYGPPDIGAGATRKKLAAISAQRRRG